MSGQSSSQNKGSRWGSLLSGAVAGLESRLDTILGEDEQASARQRAEEAAAKEKLRQKQNALKVEQSTSRASSRGRPSDRLQERLAKAVVRGTETPRSSSRAPSEKQSEPASPLPAANARSSTDSAELGAQQDQSSDPSTLTSPPDEAAKDGDDLEQSSVSALLSLPLPDLTSSAAISTPNVPSLRPSQDSGRPSIDSLPLPSTPPTTLITRRPSFLEAELGRVTKQHEEQVLNYQEELHGYLERIDALQSKLQYLASTAAKDARVAAEEMDKGSFKQKLAEKDEKIAQLLEEGQKLSSNEIKAMGNARTLRTRLQEEEKTKAELKRRLEVAEQEIIEAKDRARRAEERDRIATEKLKAAPRLEREIQDLKGDLIAANAQIAELKKMVLEAEELVDEAEKRAQTDKVEDQIKAIAELNDELSNARIEKRLVEDRMKKEINEVREKAKRQQEKANIAELELKAEIQVREDVLRYSLDELTHCTQNMEAKLEALRSRTEEASSSAPSSAQTALLRQIETLQTQYALATENWQGIESSLNARITTLEKDRDEIARREADIRKKARETNSKSRRLEDELETTKEKTGMLETDNSDLQAAMAKVQARLTAAEKTVSEARADLERERKAFEETLQSRIEEERTKWRLEVIPTSATSITESHFLGAGSPTASYTQLRKPSTPDLLGLHARRMGSASNTGSRTFSSDLPPITTESYSRPHSRRTSTNPQALGFHHPQLPVRTPTDLPGFSRQDSMPYLNGSGSIPQSTSTSVAPSINEITVGEEPLDGAPTETSSPHRTINDLVSHSTVGAGPSVQLVERMSAAVRRLESEKALHKEELARLTSQRDEARDEVVQMMLEVESARKDKEELEAKKKELGEKDRRLEECLLMLGEKSEECEELKNDVLDLKKIYRELVESTVK